MDGSFSVDLIYPWSNYGTSFLIEITLSEKLCNWPCICGLKVAQEEQDGDVQHANGSSGETETKTAQNLVTDLQFLSPPPFIFFFFPVSFPYPTFFSWKKSTGHIFQLFYAYYRSTLLSWWSNNNRNSLNAVCLTSFQKQNTGWVVQPSQRALQAQNEDSFTDPIPVLDDLLLLHDKGLLLKSQQKCKHLK